MSVMQPRLSSEGRSVNQNAAPDRAGAAFSRCAMIFSIIVSPWNIVCPVSFEYVDHNTVRVTGLLTIAMLAASAMNGAIYESTFNIFFKLKYDKIYDSALATPLTAGDVALGEIRNAIGAMEHLSALVTK